MRYPPRLAVLALAVAPLSARQESAAADLSGRLEAIRAKCGAPALGAALVTTDGLQGTWVAGVRAAGSDARVQPGDLWHLGSCTKSMTATLCALLVARGDLSWDTPLAEALPELADEMDEAFRDVTLVELLSHRAGLSGKPSWALMMELRTSELPMSEQRAKLARAVLSAQPAHAPRTAFEYANDGFVIAGHVAEVATKRPWEELMRELLFAPLGMTSAGFGAPGSAEVVDQPRGHGPSGAALPPGPLADNPAALGPAGTVHASLADWAKYVELHLDGARGDVEVGEITLTRDAFALLHRPYETSEATDATRYGFGWVVEQRPWAGGDGTALWHNGSNTMWYCVAWLGPGNGVAALVTANQATPAATAATDEVATLLIREHARRAGAAATR